MRGPLSRDRGDKFLIRNIVPSLLREGAPLKSPNGLFEVGMSVTLVGSYYVKKIRLGN